MTLPAENPYGSRFVPGDGPVPCRIVLVGEGPGAEENRWGRAWVGQAGRELWRYLWNSCHLTRDQVYCTNLVKYRVPKDGDPTDDDIKRDAPLLEDEIRNVRPEIIVTLGRWSSRYFLGDVDMEICHGIPYITGHRCVMPIVHPAAGLHSTEFQGLIYWDFEQLGKLLRGEIEPRALGDDEYPAPEYCEDWGQVWIEMADTQRLAVDTEGSPSAPWCLSYCLVPGQAMVWRPHGSRVPRFLGRVILHNSAHDLGVLRALGIELEDDQFEDTMIKAYVLCVEPQGLKALAKRHCDMEMMSYDEVVSDANHRLAFDYLVKVKMWLDKQLNSACQESATTTTRSRKVRTFAKGGKK